jgi:hypothetical protein
MTWRQRLGFACAALIVAASTVDASTRPDAPQGAAMALSKAATDSPALVSALSKEIGGTPEQAAGAAGALFSLAQSRLKPAEFSQISSAVPGMASLLGAAPVADANALSQLAKTAGGLAAAMGAFNKLGLKPELVAKAIPVLTSFVTKSGGASVGALLAGVLK